MQLCLAESGALWQKEGISEISLFRKKRVVGRGEQAHRGQIFITQTFLRSETFKDISQKRNNFLFPYELRFSKQIQALCQPFTLVQSCLCPDKQSLQETEILGWKLLIFCMPIICRLCKNAIWLYDIFQLTKAALAGESSSPFAAQIQAAKSFQLRQQKYLLGFTN